MEWYYYLLICAAVLGIAWIVANHFLKEVVEEEPSVEAPKPKRKSYRERRANIRK